MMIRASLKNLNGCAVITLRPPGGILTWQDWMCDAVSLVSLREDSTPCLGLFSFRSGDLLATFQVPPTDLEILAAANRYVLVSDELESDWQTEGTIFKAEPCDQTGGLYQGIRNQLAGNLPEAIRSYEQALKAATGLPRLRNLIGFCHRLEERLPLAEQAYQQEIDRFPHLPDAYTNLGSLYLRTDRPQLARTLFEQALERDQFYLNGLLQLSRLFAGSSGSPRLSAAINYRLLITFSDIQTVQDHLTDLARKSGLSTSEFAVKLRAGAGLVTAPKLLRLMKRLESLRLNGAYLAAMRGFTHLLEKTGDTPMAEFFQHWVAKRMSLFPPYLPGFLQPSLDRAKAAMLEAHPLPLASDPAGGSPSAGPAPARPDTEPDSPSGPSTGLSREDFYQIVLEEILQDGQITPAETVLLGRLRQALRIDEPLHQQLFAKAATFASLPLADGGRDFEPRRLLKKLILTILRDGRIDPQEQKFLELAREILDLDPEVLTATIAEVHP